MVFYRKYRPQTIGELDNKEVRDILSAVLSQKSVPHAFLFTGPKGLGKTSTARIVAKVLNCERLVNQRLASSSKDSKLNAKRYTLEANLEPCNKCDQCTSITNGTNMDVLEIDGASNRGIDEIRDLREKIRLAPLSSSKKIYIIDEVHMLTTEAFNALLKTLEEPPSHAIFVLCTTEPQKVPATIMSRCFHIPFTRATDEELLSSLKRITKGEKVLSEDEALLFIARLSEGSFRDGAKVLEQVVALANGKKITKELIESIYKVSNVDQHREELLQALAAKDTKKALQLIGKLAGMGIDMKYFIEQLISVLHQLLLAKSGVGEFKLQKLDFEITEIKTLIELLVKAHGELKYAVLPQLPLELVVIEWGEKDVVLKSTRQFEDHRSLWDSSNASTPAVSSVDLGVRPAQRDLVKNTAHAKSPRTRNNGLEEVWKEFIEKVKTQNYSIAGVLRSCKLQQFNDKMLIIEAAYKFHKDKLSEEKTLSLLEKIAKEISGKDIRVSVVLGGDIK